MPRALFWLLLACLAGPLRAEVYTYIDADGNRVFTDRPRSGNAERVELAPSNSLPATTMPPPAMAPASPPVATPSPYQYLRILLPEPDSTIQNGSSGDLIVTATSEPSLLPGHTYHLLVDGQSAAAPSRSPVFQVHNLDRGSHQLAVEILDAEGRTLESTPGQPVHIQRISLVQKRRIHPCRREDYGVRPECPLSDKPEEKRKLPFLPFL